MSSDIDTVDGFESDDDEPEPPRHPFALTLACAAFVALMLAVAWVLTHCWDTTP